MMYSVVDVAGLNTILTGILVNAAGALVGMATATATPPGEGRPLIVASMFGVTTPCVTVARERLEELGYEVLVFHQVGLGGQSLEEVVKTGAVAGVLDVTTAGLADEVGGGIWPAGPERLEVAGRLGIPQVVSLGGLDFVDDRPAGAAARALRGPAALPPRQRPGRDAADAGGVPADRGRPGAQAERRHRADRAVRAAARPLAALDRGRGAPRRRGGRGARSPRLRELVDRSRVEVHEVDAELNDPQFALAMAERLHELVAG